MNLEPKFNYPFSRILDTVGDGSGTRNIIGNYSSTVTEFRVIAPPNKNLALYHMVWYLRVNTGQGGGTGWGWQNTALTNGIQVYVQEKNPVTLSYETVFRLVDAGDPIKRQDDLHRHGGRLECFPWMGADQANGTLTTGGFDPNFHNIHQVRAFGFRFVELYGAPLVLRGNREAKLVVRLNDNMSDKQLFEHMIGVTGQQELPGNYISPGLAGN